MSQAGLIRTGGGGADEGAGDGDGDDDGGDGGGGARGQARQDPAFNKLSLTAEQNPPSSPSVT